MGLAISYFVPFTQSYLWTWYGRFWDLEWKITSYL